MSDLQVSQLLELPHMGVDKCVQMTVPKLAGETWVAAGIEDASTTRLKKNAAGVFYVVSIDDSQGSIACAASAAASSATSGSIYLYPSFRLPTFRKQIIDEALFPVGQFHGINGANSKQCRRLPKKPEDTFTVSEQLYWDFSNNQLDDTNTGYTVEAARLASPAGSTYGYPWHRWSYQETNLSTNTISLPDRVSLVGYPVISGGPDLIAGPISVDISGNYFSGAGPGSDTHGYFNDDFAVPISGNFGFHNDGNTKFQSNLDLLASATNVEYVNVYPSFRKTPQYIYPRPAYEVTVATGQDENGGTIFVSRVYEWAYRLRRYHFFNEGTGALLSSSSSWRPCITLAIPSINWERVEEDEDYWSPPAAPALSNSHIFVLNAGEFSLVSREPASAVADRYYRSHIAENTPMQGNIINNAKCDLVEDQDGDLRIFGEPDQENWTDDFPFTIDTFTKWHAGVIGMETLPTNDDDLQIKIYRTHPDTGVVTILLDWTTMSKNVVGNGPYIPATMWEPAKDYTAYDMYNWYKDISLNDIGITDIVDIDTLTVQTKLATQPTAFASRAWGEQIVGGGTFFPKPDNFFFAASEGGGYDPSDTSIAPNKRDIYNVSVVTNNGDKISNDTFVKGWLPKFYKPTCEITGTITYTISGSNLVYSVEGLAAYTPEFASFGDEIELITPPIYPANYLWQKVTRKRDGATVNGNYPLVGPAPAALVWSHKNINRWLEISAYPALPAGQVYGTLNTPIRYFPVQFKIPRFYVDIAPGRTGEEFIVETKFLVRYEWANHPATFKAVTDRQTITIGAP